VDSRERVHISRSSLDKHELVDSSNLLPLVEMLGRNEQRIRVALWLKLFLRLSLG
jgi:hypothetical protein